MIRVVERPVKVTVPLLPYQVEDVMSDDRFRWCCWSRQTGKSYAKSLRRVVRGIARGRTQVFLSAGERQSRELMTRARRHCCMLDVATEFIDDQFFEDTHYRQLELRLPGALRIIGLPANPRTARGYSGDIFLDEFAMHGDDREIWSSLFPTLLRGDGELDVASTPKGCKNVFAALRVNSRFGRSLVTLPDAVEQGLVADVAGLRKSMRDEKLFRQEFLCEFLDEATAYLTYEQIAGCEDQTLEKWVPVGDLARCKEELFVGVDIGRHRDLTVVWVLGRCGDLLVTRAVYELRGETFRRQYSLIADVLGLRRVRRCCIDGSGLGMQLAESAVNDFGGHRVEAVTFSAALKSQLAGGLRIAVEDRSIVIPVDEDIRNDWHSIERMVTAGGHVRFDASRGEEHHADRFWAAALAVHAAGDGPGRVEALGVRSPRYERLGVW